MFDTVMHLEIEEQRELLEACRDIAHAAPLFQKTMPRTGNKFNYLCTSAGLYAWTSDKQKGYRYEDTHPKTGNKLPPIPQIIVDISVKAAELAGEVIVPESALLNWYEPTGSLGLHVDNTEECDAPVISISLGADCLFAKGGKTRRKKPEIVTLKSGDVFVMSGEHRYLYHGVEKIISGTSPEELGIKSDGRLNITVRQVKPE